MKLFLIRHGQTTGDVEDRYGGTYNDHLTSQGQEQARQLANKLTGQGIQIIFSSPYHRAQETATILASQLTVPVKTMEDLRERNGYGVLSGLVKAEALRQHPQQVALLRDVYNTIDGGEPYADFAARFTLALNQLAQQPYKTVAVVTHGGPISQFFRDTLRQGEIRRDDCCFAELDAVAGAYQVLRTSGITLVN